MQRRTFVVLIGAAAGLPPLAYAQQKALPAIGFLRSTAAAPFSRHLAQAFRDGLKEAGFVDGTNVRVEYRYADNHRDRLPALAADLLRDGVAVIVGNSLAAEATKRLTRTIPIVFVTSDDPVKRGLVASLARPAGNATGFTFFGGGQLDAKRLEILHELAPSASVIGFLMDPNWPASASELAEAQTAANALGLRLAVAEAPGAANLEAGFAVIRGAGAGALAVAGAPSFSSQRPALIALARQHHLPTIYDLRDFVVEGGLVSYSGSFTEAYRQAGIYAAKILNGADPGDLPVQQPSKIELVINLKTAKALGLTVPQSLLARADEVIE